MNCNMSMSRYLFFSLLAISLILQGCGQPNSSDNTVDTEVFNQDNANRDINIQNNSNNADLTSSKPINVVSPDWGIAGTLTAMGYPPIATGDMRVWDQWVGKPELPDTVTDLGIRYQPNAELVAQLPVDMVIDNYFYEHARNLYGDVPSDSVLYMTEGEVATWQNYVKPTKQLGQLINQPQAANAYIDKSYAQIEKAGEHLHARYPNINKFAVVQFVDANNMRMYSYNSLFNVLFDMMGFEFVALDKGNGWGFTPIQLGDLAKLDDDVCLLIIEPLSPLTEEALKESLVWQRLGYGISKNSNNQSDQVIGQNKGRCMAKLELVWIYGGMSSITVLLDNLAAQNLIGGYS